MIQQSEEQDKEILSSLSVEDFAAMALEIQRQLTPEVVHQAFKQYPLNIFEVTGREHEEIFNVRLSKLPDVAKKFHVLVKE